MKISELRSKSIDDLKNELLELNKAGFGLKMQLAAGQLTKNSEINKIRRSIAQVKTILSEKGVSI